MSLRDRLLKAGSTSGAAVMSQSALLKKKDFVDTKLPILNIAFSGEVDGGMSSGLTILAGESKTFKSALSLYCMKAYFDKYPDAFAVFYDSEFGISEDYIRGFGLDPNRIIHVPVEHIEQLKFDFVKKLNEIQEGEKVFFLVDSIGQLSSKKETDDAIDEKSVADMTRAKSLRSLLRMVTIQLAKKDLPCIMINHVYVEIGAMYPKTIIPGGTAVTYSANNIFVITKAQEKDGTELAGWKFTLNVHKSRTVKEKEKLPFTVLYDGGIQKYSGMFDLALEGGFIVKTKQGWYATVDKETGEVSDKNIRAKDAETDDVLGKIIKTDAFKLWVLNRYKLVGSPVTEEEVEQTIDDEYAALEGDDE